MTSFTLDFKEGDHLGNIGRFLVTTALGLFVLGAIVVRPLVNYLRNAWNQAVTPERNVRGNCYR